MSKDPYCVLPWIHVTNHTDGRTSPCCTWKERPSSLSASQYFNSPEQAALRERMLRHDPPPGCIDCIDQQKLGTYSPRDDGWNVFNHLLKHQSFTGAASLEYMELNFSNICNLKCKMCGNDRSSKWSSDAEAMGFPVYGKLVSDVHLSDDMLRTLRFIRILGGEPLLHEDQIIDMLTRAENLGTIDRLTLGITTNGTILPNAKLLPLLQKCQNIFWTISIDAAYQLNDYIRSGSDWNVITSNLLELERLSNATGTWSINVGSVCMIYNANRMHELADWIDAHIPSLQGRHSWFPLHFPEYLAADRLPSDYLLELADRYDQLAAERPGWRADSWWRPIAMHLRSSANKVPYIQDRNDYYAAFARDSKQLITQLDRLRGDDLLAANPEIHHQLHRNNQLANP